MLDLYLGKAVSNDHYDGLASRAPAIASNQTATIVVGTAGAVLLYRPSGQVAGAFAIALADAGGEVPVGRQRPIRMPAFCTPLAHT
jgi:hypothetical protein